MEFKEKLFLFLSGIFLTSLVLGNVIGTTKFVNVFGLTVPAGVLAYPFTFLATDLICELYGKKRAQTLVWIGFFMNFFMLGLMTLGHYLQDAQGISGATSTFDSVYTFMVGNVIASMIAYLIAQSIDVRMFHFWKRLTKGKHLWLRNNGSTIVSQLVDTSAVLVLLCGTGTIEWIRFWPLLANGFLFKVMVAFLDTPLFYLGVWALKDKIHEDPDEEDWEKLSFKQEVF